MKRYNVCNLKSVRGKIKSEEQTLNYFPLHFGFAVFAKRLRKTNTTLHS